jgi:hypothetical protein
MDESRDEPFRQGKNRTNTGANKAQFGTKDKVL